jgi:solute carrier family 13 (sodium-dependent dicarboxylate transporter), member 2/3/5
VTQVPTGPVQSSARERIGFVLGPLALIAFLVTQPAGGLGPVAWRTAGLGLLMAIWWITEAIPIYATALLPLVLIPLLGIGTINEATTPYANPIIYLFMGGFIIAAGMESSGLHRRLAVAIIRTVGTQPANLIGGFMAATAFISMWVSNTATVVMLLPMATSVIRAVEAENPSTDNQRFAVALLLGLAYAASIGGVATPIGTPPTAFLVAFMDETYHFQIGFFQWMLVGVPIVAVGTPIAWWLLTRVLHPLGKVDMEGGRAILEREAAQLGPMTTAEKVVAIVASLTAVAWMTQALIERVVPAITDAGIAMTGGVLMFLIPVSWKRGEFVLRWQDAERMPWSVLVLFGGGLSLAAAIQSTGLAQGIGNAMAAFGTLPLVLVMVAVTIVVIFLTELTSNTATAATFIPLVASVSVGMGRDPLFLAIPAALAAGLSFMMPAGTPPNALIFGTGRLTIPVMAKSGIVMNVLFTILINIAVFAIALHVFHLHAG